ncbi:MAG: carbonic anhydrase [Clostridiales bacterium]|nr:carbonic anhydrase [Clostridiales bacterium]
MKQDFTVALNALERLKEGNKIYLNTDKGVGDVSLEKRQYTYKNGQHPYAVVVSCADSRVIPEAVFSVGIGDLFVIRVAGNVVGEYELGSIEYAVEHLGCRLVVVLGHTCCGAVNAALEQNHGLVAHITDEIRRAIGDEHDTTKASVLNVKQSVAKVKEHVVAGGLLVCGALYHTESGAVDFEL